MTIIGFDVEGVEAVAEALANDAGLGEAFRAEKGNYEWAPVRSHFIQRAQNCLTAGFEVGFVFQRVVA